MYLHISLILWFLLASKETESKPIVDPGVYVLQGVTTCRNGLGYCVFGAGCQVDKDFIKDDEGGHCDGLRQAYSTNSTKVTFVCCQYSGEPQNETYETTVSPYTISDSKLTNIDIELELADEIPEDIDPTTLVNIIGVITDKTGIVSLVTEPYTEAEAEEASKTTIFPLTTSVEDAQNLTREKISTATEMAQKQTTFSELDSTSLNNMSLNEIPLEITFLLAKKKKKTPPNTTESSKSSSASGLLENTTEMVTQSSSGELTDEASIPTVTASEAATENPQIETPIMPYPSMESTIIHNKHNPQGPSLEYEHHQTPQFLLDPISSSKNSIPVSGSRDSPHPINLSSCGQKKITTKRRRFENIFSRGSAYDFCWSAAIMLKQPTRDGSKFICNGALVEQDLVITTATCLQRLDVQKLENYRVVLGDSVLTDDLPYGIQFHDILTTIVHPSYEYNNENAANDIGIIRLRDQATLGQNVCLVCIPQSSAEVPLEACLTTGFSQTQDRSRKSIAKAGLLSSRPVSITNKLECDKTSKHYSLLKEKNPNSLLCEVFDKAIVDCEVPVALSEPMICLSDNKWYLTGLSSYGSACTGRSVVYTRLSSYSDWILSERILLYGYITHKTA